MSRQASAVKTNHCSRQSSVPPISQTATEQPAMPRPMPEKWMPSSGRWLWRISQLRISPVPSSMPAALDRPAMKRDSIHTQGSVVRPIIAVLTMATTRPMRYSRSLSTRSLISEAISAPLR